MTHAVGTVEMVLSSKSPALWIVPPETTVYDAIALMADKDIGSLLVMDGETLSGIFTERDYTRNIVLKGKSSRETPVIDVVDKYAVTTSPWTSIEEALASMTENRVRHLPVVDGQRVIGLVSIGDLVKWIISAQTAALDQLSSYVLGNPG